MSTCAVLSGTSFTVATWILRPRGWLLHETDTIHRAHYRFGSPIYPVADVFFTLAFVPLICAMVDVCSASLYATTLTRLLSYASLLVMRYTRRSLGSPQVRRFCRRNSAVQSVSINWHQLFKYTHMGRTLVAGMTAVRAMLCHTFTWTLEFFRQRSSNAASSLTT